MTFFRLFFIENDTADPIGGVDVVLEEKGDPMEGPAGTFALSFSIQRGSDCQDIRVHLDHRVQLWPLMVRRLNARQIPFH